MAAKAFVLITTSVGKTKAVLSALKKMEGIKTADAVMGPYDIITVVEGESVDKVGKVITEKFHKIEGVERTTTCQVIRIT